MKKLLTSMFILCLICALFVTPVSAATMMPSETLPPLNLAGIAPRLSTSSIVYCTTDNWNDVVSDNNLFKVTTAVRMPRIGQDYGYSTADVYIRVIDGNGNVIGASQTLSFLGEVTFTIPANSGTYTVQAKAVRANGTRYFYIDDGWH